MNRTLRLESFGIGPVGGEREAMRGAAARLTVASSWRHPNRGSVRCPAAPLVLAESNGAGLPGALGPLGPLGPLRPLEPLGPLGPLGERTGPPSLGAVALVVHSVSYLDADGSAVGLAVAAPSGDAALLHAAGRLVTDWAGAFRTRRLLLAGPPSCRGLLEPAASAGAERAVGGALVPEARLGATEAGVPSGLGAPGTAGAAAGGAAGAPAAPPRAGCRCLTLAWRSAVTFHEQGDTVLLVGGGTSVAPVGAPVGESPWAVQDVLVPVGSVEQVSELRVADPRRVSYVLRPGVEMRAALPVVAALRAAFPRLRGQHPDQWCYAATDAWEERAGVCRDSEVTFWLDHAGRPGEVDELTGLGREREALHRITAPTQLRRSWIGPAATVGLVISDDASGELLHDLVEVICGLGPVSALRRRVSTELGVPVGCS